MNILTMLWQVALVVFLTLMIFSLGFIAGRKQADSNRMTRMQEPVPEGGGVGFILWCPDGMHRITADNDEQLPLDGTVYPVEQYPKLAKELLDEHQMYTYAGPGRFRVPDWTNQRSKG